ncbi:hypothetical protein SAMN02745172_01241 [Pseudoxanthobacter soli DSM 19599]|uniref:DUF3828 domain-containing protein n=2 Tax=Pseudoxanthobacter TaxID=433838 RepID=A0A1M7ZDR7_9HYPH|nr:hypothetical protein SAMN02745172_01241 [Pseudoxanthobacter soli DSM 19599]
MEHMTLSHRNVRRLPGVGVLLLAAALAGTTPFAALAGDAAPAPASGAPAPAATPPAAAPAPANPAAPKPAKAPADYVNDTPGDLLAAIYEPYLDGSPDSPAVSAFDASRRKAYFTPRLLKLIEALDRGGAAEGGVLGRLGFDPVIDGFDDDLSNFALSQPVEVGGTAMSSATFSVNGMPSEIVFIMIKTDGKWRVDDIERISDVAPWSLSSLLSADG